MTIRELTYPEIMEIRHGDYALTISYDQSPESPRDWDNFGTFYLWHRGYVSPDKCEYGSMERFLLEWTGAECTECGYTSADHVNGWSECENYTPDTAAPGNDPDSILLLVDHNDGYGSHRFTVADLGADPFGSLESIETWERFDGVLFVTGDRVRAEFEGDAAAAYSALRAELSTYSTWANGEVFSATWSRFDRCECCRHESETYLESVCGHYRPFDVADYAPAEIPGDDLVAILADFLEWSGE